MSINSVSFKLNGDAATLGNRMKQTNLQNADKYEWEQMYYGTWGKVASNVNSEVETKTGEGDYVNNNNYVNSVDDDAEVLYENISNGLFMELDWSSGEATIKNRDSVAEDLGLVDEKTGESAVSFVQTGKNELLANTVQQQDGAEFDAVSMSLNQSAFDSKWKSSYWTIYNADLNKAENEENESEYYLYNKMRAYWRQYFTEEQNEQANTIPKFIEEAKNAHALFTPKTIS